MTMQYQSLPQITKINRKIYKKKKTATPIIQEKQQLEKHIITNLENIKKTDIITKTDLDQSSADKKNQLENNKIIAKPEQQKEKINRKNKYKNKRPKPSVRKALARLLAVQASYEIEIANANVDDIIAEYINHRIYEQNKKNSNTNFRWVNKGFFQNIVKGCFLNIADIDAVIEKKLHNRKTAQLEILLLIILRIGVYEALYTGKIIKSVIIEEYIELARTFFYNDSPALVNAILEAVINDKKTHAEKIHVEDKKIHAEKTDKI